jgi:hypothetical protein
MSTIPVHEQEQLLIVAVVFYGALVGWFFRRVRSVILLVLLPAIPLFGLNTCGLTLHKCLGHGEAASWLPIVLLFGMGYFGLFAGGAALVARTIRHHVEQRRKRDR